MLQLDQAVTDFARVARGLWVLSGTARLRLGDRVILVEPGQAAEFSTMIPHAIAAHGGPVEILVIIDHDGERSHLRPSGEAVGP